MMKRAMSSVSSRFMPATGSSSSSSLGSMARARPSSTRFCTPYGSRPTGSLRHGLELEEVDDLLDHGAVAQLLVAGPAEPGERRERAVADVLVPAEHEVVEHREVREQLDVLEGAGHAELGDGVRLEADQLLAVELHRALLRPVDAGQHVEDAGLAGAVGADDREQLVARGPRS